MINSIAFLLIYFSIEICSVLWVKGIPPINFGSISIYPMDIISIILVLSFLYNFISRRELRISRIIYFLIALLLSISLAFVIGFYQFGIEKASNALRMEFYFFASILLGVSLRLTAVSIRRILKFINISSMIIIGIVFFRWFLVFFGNAGELSNYWGSASGLNNRVITAGQTLFLAQVLIINIYANLYHIRIIFYKIIPFIILLVIILLQHRTIWVVLLITVLLVLIFERRYKNYFVKKAIVFSYFVSFPIIFFFGKIFPALRISATNISTFQWRLESWRVVLSNLYNDGIQNIIFGHPYGTGISRYLFGTQLTSVAAHNFYVQISWDLGVVGLFAIMGLYFLSMERVIFHRNHVEFRLATVLILSQLIYFITYSPNFDQGFLFGLILNYIFISKFLSNGLPQEITSG